MATRGRFLIVLWDGGGNVGPALAIARRLTESGHLVRVLGSRSLQPKVEARGLRFRRFEKAPEWGEHLGRVLDWGYMTELWCGPGVGQDLNAELAREPAEVIVLDFFLFGGLAAAERSGLPTAGLGHTLYHLNREGKWVDELWPAMLPNINTTRRVFGVAPLPSARQLWDALRVLLVLTPQGFDQPVMDLPANVQYVGPIFDPAEGAWGLPWPPDHPDPLVLVSFSTTYQNQEAAIQRVLDALAELPVRGLVTAGPAVDPNVLKPPANAVVRTYIDHQVVLPHAAAVVTHAGLSTVMAALAHGVPLLCMPMGRDQHTNAESVETCGAGRMISPEADALQLRAAMVDVLESPSYRKGAQRMATVIQRDGNGSRAIQLLENLLV